MEKLEKFDVENDDNETNYHYRMKNLDTGELGDLRNYEPVPVVHEHTTTLTNDNTTEHLTNQEPISTTERVKQSLKSFGWKVFQGIETVGESVVSFLGLDDSYFQEVLDNMTEEEKKNAVKIHQQREEEYKKFFAENPDHPKHPDKMAAVLAEEEEQEQAMALAALSVLTGGVVALGEGGGSSHTTGYEAVENARIDENDIELQVVDDQIETETSSIITEPIVSEQQLLPVPIVSNDVEKV